MISPAYATLWFFIFSVPWENLIILPGLGTISRIMGILALGFALLAAVMHGRLRRWHAFHVAALLFVAWCGTILLVQTHGSELPKKFYTFGQLLGVVWMTWELAVSKRAVQGLLLAYVMGAYVAALDTIMAYRSVEGAGRRFVAGTFDPNDLAMTMVLALPMAWYLGLTFRQPILRWCCRGYPLVALLAIGLTGSRGGMLTSGVALLVVPLTVTKLTPGRLMAAIVVLVLSATLAVVYVPDRVKERLATTRAEVEDVDFGGRFRLWRAGVNAFTQRPLMGYGTSSFRQAITPQLGSTAQVAHNSYISVLVEQGLVGLVLYTSMFVAVFLSVLKLPFLERRFGLVLLAALGVAMMPLTWEDRKSVWFILAALVGMAHAQLAGSGRLMAQQPAGGAVPPAGPPESRRPREPAIAPARNADWDPSE